jgi:dihydrofolate reductase
VAKLIYSMLTSLDGYVADERGNFDWAAPDAEVHRFVNDLERPIGTYLYGRRMYEVMRFWETAHMQADQDVVALDYAKIWQAADKIVYSRTLREAATARTRVEHDFDPAALRRMKTETQRDLSIAGPELAASAIRAGLVDEFQVFLNPVVVGGGTHWLPRGVTLHLELRDERRFASGVVYLRYRRTLDA